MIQLQDFTGRWSMAREIEDFRADARSDLTGTCDFVADGEGGFRLDERGFLHLPGRDKPLQAERRYFWRAVAQEIAVFFDDGRFFHSFDPNAATPEADHACDPDTYHVRYEFADWPNWTANWRVTGPRKDYRFETRYWRHSTLA